LVISIPQPIIKSKTDVTPAFVPDAFLSTKGEIFAELLTQIYMYINKTHTNDTAVTAIG